jgi:hypothetical protein
LFRSQQPPSSTFLSSSSPIWQDIYYVSHVYRFFLHLFLDVGLNCLTTSTFVGALGTSLALFLFRFGAIKPPVPFYPSLLAIWISASPFFIHFYRTAFFSLRHLSTDYSLRHCIANNLSFAFQCSPQSRYSTYAIGGTFTLLVEQLLHFLLGLPRIPRTVPTPLSTLVHIPLKQSRQCRAWTRLEFWRFV